MDYSRDIAEVRFEACFDSLFVSFFSDLLLQSICVLSHIITMEGCLNEYQGRSVLMAIKDVYRGSTYDVTLTLFNRGPARFHRSTPNKRFEPVFSTVIMAVCSLFNSMLLLTD